MTKNEFIGEAEERISDLESENYHTEASFLSDVLEKVAKASDKTWKDVVIKKMLQLGDI